MRAREIAVRRIYCRKAADNEAAGGLDGGNLCLWSMAGQLRAMLARGPLRRQLSRVGLMPAI